MQIPLEIVFYVQLIMKSTALQHKQLSYGLEVSVDKIRLIKLKGIVRKGGKISCCTGYCLCFVTVFFLYYGYCCCGCVIIVVVMV